MSVGDVFCFHLSKLISPNINPTIPRATEVRPRIIPTRIAG